MAQTFVGVIDINFKSYINKKAVAICNGLLFQGVYEKIYLQFSNRSFTYFFLLLWKRH